MKELKLSPITRSATGARLPSSGGASWVARQGGVSLVPVALCGFWEIWRPGSADDSTGR